MIALRLTIGCYEVPSDEPFKLYKNGNPVKTDRQGNPLIDYSCFGSGSQFPHIRYMPADKYDQPRDHTDPNGHYALFDYCSN